MMKMYDGNEYRGDISILNTICVIIVGISINIV